MWCQQVSASSLFDLLQSLTITLPEDPLSISDSIVFLHVKGQATPADLPPAGFGTSHQNAASQHSHTPQHHIADKGTAASMAHLGKSMADSSVDQRGIIAAKPPVGTRVFATFQVGGFLSWFDHGMNFWSASASKAGVTLISPLPLLSCWFVMQYTAASCMYVL